MSARAFSLGGSTGEESAYFICVVSRVHVLEVVCLGAWLLLAISWSWGLPAVLPHGLPQHRCFLPRASKENLLIKPAMIESSVKLCNGGMTCHQLCRVMQPNRESDSPSPLPYSTGSKQGRSYLHSWKELQKNRDTKRQKSTEGHLSA